MNVADILRDIGGGNPLAEPLIESIYQGEVSCEFHPLVSAWPKEHGFDGLHNPHGECACEPGDLAPGSCLYLTCVAGHKIVCGGCEEHGFCIDEKAEEWPC